MSVCVVHDNSKIIDLGHKILTFLGIWKKLWALSDQGQGHGTT